MKALVVFDSFFGNTEQIARSVGKGLGTGTQVKVINVKEATPDMTEGLDFLVVGSPTRAFSPSPAIKAFIQKIPAGRLDGVKVAAFDTRIRMTGKTPGFIKFMVKLFGYADKPILDGLKKKGGLQVAASEGFYVLDSEGPLDEGELERAARWAESIKKQ